MVRISAMPWTLFSRMDSSTSRTVCALRSLRESTAVDWMAIALKWLAIMSCSSLAIRVRSAFTAAR